MSIKAKISNVASKKISQYKMEITNLERRLRALNIERKSRAQRGDEHGLRSIIKTIAGVESDIKGLTRRIWLLDKAKSATTDKPKEREEEMKRGEDEDED